MFSLYGYLFHPFRCFTVSSFYRRLSTKKRPCSLMGGTVSLSVSCFI
ncbi:hypothetical protein HMPREF9303_0999 [Prevotella denticola CRIS 18C-A]|uniref:Uncharacterized protein n=1 Tax=Prevotella denticola CRIS 18C-A TaxID=944557 RepID=F0H9P8_9BACT|nr:hypothetical protein HMPREF9303_0999 [Prevotella denticola CRIS 18C-A]